MSQVNEGTDSVLPSEEYFNSSFKDGKSYPMCDHPMTVANKDKEMIEQLKSLENQLNLCGETIYINKKDVKVDKEDDIDRGVPNSPGVYWIKTNMPFEEMRLSIEKILGRPKKILSSPPKGICSSSPDKDGFYVAYSGTHYNIKARLRQHLFNGGGKDTGKLGCIINQEPFLNYGWYVSFHLIDRYEIRYVIEAWSRMNKGWPKFCYR